MFIIVSACNPLDNTTKDRDANVITKTDTVTIIKTDTVVVEKNSIDWEKSKIVGLQFLYRNCRNDLSINTPSDNVLIRTSSSDAKIIQSKSDQSKHQIVPTGKICDISTTIIEKGRPVYRWNEKFKVIEPPMPNINIKVNGRIYNGAIPISKNFRISIRLEADNDFRTNFPADARYGFTSVDVLAQLSLGLPTKINFINTAGKDATKGIPIALGTQVRQLKSGTLVYLRLKDIYRINYEGKKIPDKRFNELNRIISFVVK